ncbi:MAG TPA: OsmC family protein [Solirubrobacterales bacterium]|jgi:osmotically inducible protein OsmC|nr:OsmC family protein [Solirubrobacterales bacterium]
MATRNGSAEWRGDLKGGSGTVKVGDGVFEGNYSFSSRFEDADGTNPEELIGAAHAGCFAMALSLVLAEADHPPESLEAEARVHLRLVEGLPTIAKIDLDVQGSVPGIDEDAFRSYAEKAKDGCVVSRALSGVPEITLDARLA